jgi:hypothetical protein
MSAGLPNDCNSPSVKTAARTVYTVFDSYDLVFYLTSARARPIAARTTRAYARKNPSLYGIRHLSLYASRHLSTEFFTALGRLGGAKVALARLARLLTGQGILADRQMQRASPMRTQR